MERVEQVVGSTEHRRNVVLKTLRRLRIGHYFVNNLPLGLSVLIAIFYILKSLIFTNFDANAAGDLLGSQGLTGFLRFAPTVLVLTLICLALLYCLYKALLYASGAQSSFWRGIFTVAAMVLSLGLILWTLLTLVVLIAAPWLPMEELEVAGSNSSSIRCYVNPISTEGDRWLIALTNKSVIVFDFQEVLSRNRVDGPSILSPRFWGDDAFGEHFDGMGRGEGCPSIE